MVNFSLSIHVFFYYYASVLLCSYFLTLLFDYFFFLMIRRPPRSTRTDTLFPYTTLFRATDLGQHLQQEVVQFAASGFRDFTRIAASDPIMWRDIFLNNRDALLEVSQRMQEDLARLQRAIRWREGAEIEQLIRRTREIGRKLIDANQA